MAKINIEEHKVDMTPMIDMVFLLLTFFMFTAKLVEIDIDRAVGLPNASASRPDNRGPSVMIVNLHKDDDGIYLYNQHYTPDQLVPLLIEGKRRDPNATVVIRGDGRAYHRNLVRVMECCAKAGLLNVKVAVVPESELKGKGP